MNQGRKIIQQLWQNLIEHKSVNSSMIFVQYFNNSIINKLSIFRFWGLVSQFSHSENVDNMTRSASKLQWAISCFPHFSETCSFQLVDFLYQINTNWEYYKNIPFCVGGSELHWKFYSFNGVVQSSRTIFGN